ncbi:MAG: 2-phospho-L-lactate transferase [Candidatus Thorarchaeota archaeon]
MITFLSGGTGTPKLIQGFRRIIDDSEIAVIANSADDIWMYGLYISPDIDTLIYLFSGLLDEDKHWGVEEDSFYTLDFLRELEDNTWFNLGDKDLGLHLFRTKKMEEGYNQREIIQEISKKLGIRATILPSTNSHIETRIVTSNDKDIHFQEFWVKHRGEISIKKVYFQGIETAKIPAEIIQILEKSELVIVGPSNPITSIKPILKLKEIRKWLEINREKCWVISPIIGNKPISGPTSKLMTIENLETSPIEIARIYKKLCKTIVIDVTDKNLQEIIRKETGMNVITENILFKNVNIAQKLAETILDKGLNNSMNFKSQI